MLPKYLKLLSTEQRQAFVVTFDIAKLEGGTMYNVPWNYWQQLII
jgi:hypothetical protein